LVARVWECIAAEGGLRQHGLRDADILVDGAVPYDAEDVLDVMVAEVLEESNIVSQFEQVVLEHSFQVGAIKVGLESLCCLERQSDGPGHIGRALMFQDGVDYLSFGHSLTSVYVLEAMRSSCWRRPVAVACGAGLS